MSDTPEEPKQSSSPPGPAAAAPQGEEAHEEIAAPSEQNSTRFEPSDPEPTATQPPPPTAESPAAEPPATRPEPPANADRPARRRPWIPILVVAAIAVALGLGAVALRAVTGDADDDSAYVVEPFTPSTELITARDRVEAYAEPDTSSRIVVIFGDSVTLNVSGRVARGLGNDWYAIAWNDQTAFVRAQDVTPGSGAPPAPIVRERRPREEEKEEEKPEELTEPEQEVVAEAPAQTGALGVGDVNWVRQPNARDFARFFPDEALDAGQSGSVTLSCIIGGSGRLACSVASESPQGYGFGQAAIGISRQLRVRTTLPDGSSAEGREMRLPLSFRAG